MSTVSQDTVDFWEVTLNQYFLEKYMLLKLQIFEYILVGYNTFKVMAPALENWGHDLRKFYVLYFFFFVK